MLIVNKGEKNPLREHMRADVFRVFLTHVPTYYLPSSDTFTHTHTIYKLKFSKHILGCSKLE